MLSYRQDLGDDRQRDFLGCIGAEVQARRGTRERHLPFFDAEVFEQPVGARSRPEDSEVPEGWSVLEQVIEKFTSKKLQRFVQLKTYFALNCQGDGANSALRIA